MSRPTGVFKTHNEYAAQLGDVLYGEVPKAVFAAIAVSALTSGGDSLGDAQMVIAREWAVLHTNGIVPQPPSKAARDALAMPGGRTP